MGYRELVKDLEKLKNPGKAKIFQRFFKTGKGEYGEGDVFWGLTVPQTQSVTKNYLQLSLEDIQKLLEQKIHECRWSVCMILNSQYKKAGQKEKEKLARFYLKNARKFNNWDLVDTTAPKILGDYLFDKDKSILYEFAVSGNLWERRISIMATAGFIDKNQFKDTLKIAEILLNDKQDLIHKAVGWMLREVGKRDLKTEEKFLQRYVSGMPRTMLRYAIEKFPEAKRKKYLAK